MADITINGVTVDPQAPSPLVAAANAAITAAAGQAQPGAAAIAAAGTPLPTSSEGTNYILVQAKGPLTSTERTQLVAAGATILERVPVNAYVARYGSPDLGPVRSLPFVTWAGPYLRGFKIPASLSPASADTPGGKRMDLASAIVGAPPVMNNAPKTVDVVFHRGTDKDAAAKEVARAAGLDPDEVRPSGDKVRLVIQASRLNRVAAVDAVRHVEEVFPNKLHNNVARQILGLEPANPGVFPFQGQGEVVAVADTGFDRGSTANVHPAFTARVKKLYALGRLNKSNDPDGHGTHVAGSVLGDGQSATLGQRIRGTAPLAQLVLQSLLDSAGGLGGIPADLRELLRVPYEDDGARVHTNSWGSTVGDGRYDSQAFEVDDFVWEHRDCVVCFAAGNAGRDRDANGLVDPTSITPPATAKNCVTVGASENDRPNEMLTYGLGWPSDFPANPIASDRTANNPGGIAAFSSRGPTQQQRFKPDLVAPGTYVLSARSRDTSGTGWGATADPAYMFEGGTSMATPLVAGCCALVREYLITQRGLPRPSAALVKAMLINGATDLPGQYMPSEAGAIPNFSEGFGRVDMGTTTGKRAAEILEIRDEGRELDTNDEETLSIQLPAAATNLKVTLVWTDPPGADLQNDLDLIVRAGGQARHGNMPPGSNNFDRVNNVEQVIWHGVPAGGVEIVVKAFSITDRRQSFALVVRAS